MQKERRDPAHERLAMNRMLLGYSPDLDIFDDAMPAPPSVDRETSVLETDHTEEAAELLEVAGRPGLPMFIARLLRSAAGAPIAPAVESALVRLLQRAARTALPTMSAVSPDNSAQASRFFGIELEGLSPEDQEFEAARRFAQLIEAAARRAALAPPHLQPAAAAWLAAARAAKRHAPGWLAAQRPSPSATGLNHRSARVTAGGSRPFPLQGAHHA
jgi:hypothetical protein